MEWGATGGGSCLCAFVSAMHAYEREHALLKGVGRHTSEKAVVAL